ncbi:MAG TPA: NADH:ubiquinone oxidoreductase [Deltaproteobacteria bacterium]|nr:MAG: NADH:ubiquinone oxidoreductase [Deltaproteobacteria bacterium GWA2_55_82]OGQ65234.1 MAG: NADH:ubiquinone oxidoreductase [Deltaproteobacteria bacterium RIFCSPLOWO2_02_FULL_55_12]OIJ74794.1 MAG: NADH:ubiquinone oxidoreductase [Deltaproteobacteria bacterium GWC2_55_46]HBG45723.1 NADH:ubiquinone oxidoreductase [Deltaproteobacteria bacterium]HCY11131.1 NADH:ubiquinone oxidoreductase [Deltaproteobacteria bacterium]
MEAQEKPKVAFFSFTCCEGCQLMVLSCERELPDILSQIKIVNFREAMTEKSNDYDIAFVEGSISRKDEIRKLKKIRKQAKVLVALGACSSTGGLNCLKNRYPMEEVKEKVYGKKAARSFKLIDTIPARPVDAVVDVDYYLHGCPISKKEFLSFLTALLMGKKPEVANYPVCVDCKLAGNICVFEKGMTCMGPVSRAGCDAICVTYGTWCWGCRGTVDNPNIDSHEETLERYGLTAEAVIRKFALYGQCKTGKKCPLP